MDCTEINRAMLSVNGPYLWNVILQQLGEKYPRTFFYIAGGAVRDWFLKTNHRDIDVFYADTGAGWRMPDMQDVRGWEYVRPLSTEAQKAEYHDSKKVVNVQTYMFNGHQVQLIGLQLPCGLAMSGQDVVDDFNIDISRFWYEACGQMNADERAIDDVYHKQVTVHLEPGNETRGRAKGLALASKLGFSSKFYTPST